MSCISFLLFGESYDKQKPVLCRSTVLLVIYPLSFSIGLGVVYAVEVKWSRCDVEIIRSHATKCNDVLRYGNSFVRN